MYVVKVKKDSKHEPEYVSTWHQDYVSVVFADPSYERVKKFMMPLDEAKTVFNYTIRNANKSEDSWYGTPTTTEYVALVKLSTYAPYGEHSIIEYRGF